jgi:Flp pilus assembly protein TadD
MRLATHGSKVRFYLHTMNTQQRVSGMSCRWKFAHSSRPVMKAGLLAALAFSCATPPASAQKMLRLTLPRGGVLTPVQKLNQKGVEQIEKRNYEGAEKSFYKAYLYDPSDPFTLNNLGYISEVQGRVDEAEKFYQLAVEQGSYATIDSSTEKNLKGKPMMDALGTLQNLPMRINRINVLGMQLLMQKRPFEAQTVFEQALALDPSNAFTLNNLGVADESTGDFESALKHYEAAADAHSTTPLVVTLDRSARGKPLSEVAANSATDLRKRMDKMDPDQIRSTMLATRGVVAINQNDWKTARKDFLDAYKLNPESAFALNNRAYVAERDGDLEGAKAFYESARKAEDANARVGLASNASAQGEYLSAVAGESHDSVGTELNAATERRRGHGVIILRHRNGAEEDQPVPLLLKPRDARGRPIAPNQPATQPLTQPAPSNHPDEPARLPQL